MANEKSPDIQSVPKQEWVEELSPGDRSIYEETRANDIEVDKARIIDFSFNTGI